MDKQEYIKRNNLKQEIYLKFGVASIDEKMRGSLICFGYILGRESNEPVTFERREWNEKNIFKIFLRFPCLEVLIKRIENSFSYLEV